MSINDPELKRLVVNLSVTWTPLARHTRGVTRGNKSTLEDSSTVTDHSVTVQSGADSYGIPMEVNTEQEDMQAINGKRFKIFVVPTWDGCFDPLSFQLIGQGAYFCTAKSCNTAHHHALVKTVKPGEIYVAKLPTTAFVSPSILESVIDTEVCCEWKSLLLSLPEWNEKFIIARSASDNVPASAAAMEMQENYFRMKALNFKTPVKRKRESEEGNFGPVASRCESLFSFLQVRGR